MFPKKKKKKQAKNKNTVRKNERDGEKYAIINPCSAKKYLKNDYVRK
jgi:hypothetical protein